MAKLKTPAKIGIAVVAGLAIFGGLNWGIQSGIIPMPALMAAKVPDKVSIPISDSVRGVPAQDYQLTAAPAPNTGTCAKILLLPWNAESPVTLANGGAHTTGDSLVHQFAGGCVEESRIDDYGVMQDSMVKFAQGRKAGNPNPTDGAPFIMIMGDGWPQLAASLQPALAKYGQHAAVIDVVGFSYGEDKCLAPATNGNPQNAKGDVIAAVARDGDQNICVKWAGDNGIRINTDNTVYDPDAINFVDTKDFVEADKKFNTNFCEMRKVAHNGVIDTKAAPHNTCVNGVATWTPGDVDVTVNGRGGVVSLASTKEYNQQMPAVLIGNVEWMKENRAFVVGALRAFDRASFQIRHGDLTKMGQVNAQIWGAHSTGDETKPEYWSKYFVGENGTDKQGNVIPLGGSRVTTLAEARDYFGLTPGSYNVYKAVYDTFGKYDRQFYPKDVPSVPAYNTVVDTSYLTEALAGVAVTTAPKTFTEAKPITKTVSQNSVHIKFATGKATIDPASMDQLFSIADQASITSLRIRIDGHTDNTGNSAKNQALSQARAQAVADWLVQQAPQTFPKERFSSIRGYGDTKPIADNSTESGRAQNRRVDIILGESQ